MDKVLLKGSSIAEREEENRRYRESHHQIHQKLKQNFVSGKKNTKKIFSIFNICKGTFTEPLTFILDENLQDINDKVHYDNEEQSNKW